MIHLRLTLPATLAALVLTGAAAFADTGITTGDTPVGKVLTNADGMTLYTLDKDSDGTPTCYDKCAANWPPLVAPSGASAEGDFGLTERKDGTMQWTYSGKPLYLWKNDVKPGDVTGDGVGGVWHAAQPKE
ncbi:MAG: hypothetical protein WCD16_00045 [Paracoccaceae bacterium]